MKEYRSAWSIWTGFWVSQKKKDELKSRTTLHSKLAPSRSSSKKQVFNVIVVSGVAWMCASINLSQLRLSVRRLEQEIAEPCCREVSALLARVRTRQWRVQCAVLRNHGMRREGQAVMAAASRGLEYCMTRPQSFISHIVVSEGWYAWWKRGMWLVMISEAFMAILLPWLKIRELGLPG